MKRLRTIEGGTDIYRLFLSTLICIDFPPEIVKHHIWAPIIEMMQYVEAKITNYNRPRIYMSVEHGLSGDDDTGSKEKKIPFSIRRTPIMKMIGYLNYEYRSNIEFVYLGHFFILTHHLFCEETDAPSKLVRLKSGDMCDLHKIDSPDTTLSDLMMLSYWKKLIYNSVEVKRRKIEM